MKKWFAAVVSVLCVAIVFTACGAKNAAKVKNVDVDLTALSSTMVYSEVYNMMIKPEDYIGKVVKMKGNFATYEGEQGTVYYACVVADATACCQQGLEFTPEKEMKYPDEFPDVGTEIEVVGSFNTYQEGENTYFRLENAVMDVTA